MKRTITVLIICFIILPSIAVISEETQKDYTYENLRFMCTDGNGFNEVKYQLMVQMYEQQKRESQSISEIDSINQESNTIESISSGEGLMDSSWPMKCHDTFHTGRSPYSTLENNGAEQWSFRAEGSIQGGPIIDGDGTIYFGCLGPYFYALNPDGTLKWKFYIGDSIWSTPAIGEDGTIFIGSYDSYLYAINPDGTLKWKFYAHAFTSIGSSPAIADDGTIYFGVMGPEEIGRIYAVTPNGQEKWHYDTGYLITSDPAIDSDGTVYIGSGDTYFYALNPDGTLKWRFKTGHYVKGPPSIADDGTIYFGSYDSYLYALYSNGSMKWRIKTGSGSETNPSIGSDGTIYVGDDKLYAINSDGTLKWNFDLGDNSRIFTSCPAISADDIIYIGTNIGESSGGDIIAINPDGTERWRQRIADNWVDSSPCISKEGIVYIGSSSGFNDGYLYAFGPGNVNNPPNKPQISGPTSGKIGETYSYIISTIDPENDDIYYYVSWGDGSNSDWQGPYISGTEITLSHTWNFQGSYSIRAKTKDELGSESDWETLEVTMPKSKTYSLLDRLIERWSFLRCFNLT